MKKKYYCSLKKQYFGGLFFVILIIWCFYSANNLTSAYPPQSDYNYFSVIKHIIAPSSPLGKLSEHDPITITCEQNFTDYGFSGNGTEVNPYVIENLNISTTEEKAIAIYNVSVFYVLRNCLVQADRYGIYVENTTLQGNSPVSYLPLARFENNTCYNSWRGMNIYRAWNCTVQNNSFLNNEQMGLRLDLCWYSSVSNNTCVNNFRGITLYDSCTSMVSNNTCLSNFVGLTLWSSSGTIAFDNLCTFNDNSGIQLLVNYVTLYNNTCSHNGEAGIDSDGASSSTIFQNNCTENQYGLYIDAFYVNVTENCCTDNDYGLYVTTGSWYATFTKNTCSHNLIYGIISEGSKECTFQYNFISHNTHYGLYLTNNSKGSTIAYNHIVDNNLGGSSQAYDDGEGNIWYDEEQQMGNHWSDWKKEGYNIDGSAGSVDLYPLDENLERLPLRTDANVLYSVLSLGVLTLVAIYLRKKLKCFHT